MFFVAIFFFDVRLRCRKFRLIQFSTFNLGLKVHESKAMKCKDCEDEKLICPGPYNFEKHRNEVSHGPGSG